MRSRTGFASRHSGLALLALLAAAGCREQGGEGKWYEVSGKIFVFNYRVATATYVVTLAPMRPMQESQVAVASFENPAGGDPLIVRQKVWPKLGKVTLESPPLDCVVKGKPYAISIRIEDGTDVKQTIETTLTSSEDETILPDRPLVVGPAYTPNPDVAGHPNGKIDDPTKVKCPSAA